MKILLAADGSQYTQKALEFIVGNKSILGDDELAVINVQPVMPGRVTTMLGSAAVASYHAEEANKVLEPIRKFLDGQAVRYSCYSVTGAVVEEIVFAANKENAQMIVMGTHGHGLVGRALMGSIAQRLVVESVIPVLLVK